MKIIQTHAFHKHLKNAPDAKQAWNFEQSEHQLCARRVLCAIPVGIHAADHEHYLHGKSRDEINPEPHAEIVLADFGEVPDLVPVVVQERGTEVEHHIDDEEHIDGVVQSGRFLQSRERKVQRNDDYRVEDEDDHEDVPDLLPAVLV